MIIHTFFKAIIRHETHKPVLSYIETILSLLRESSKIRSLMLLSFPSTTFFFNRPIDHQLTSNDRLKPVLTTGLVNMHIANLGNNEGI